MSAFGGKADMPLCGANVCLWHLASFRCAAKFGRYWVHNGHSRDIGIKLTTQVWYMTTHPISPDVDQDRFYLEQDLIMSGAVSRFGFVRGVGVSSMPDARVNLINDPYLTDGLRLVLFLNTPRRAFDQIEFLDWERVRQ
jgi:hypothetical protein